MGKYIVITWWSALILLMQEPILAYVRNVYEAHGAQGIQDSINVSAAYDTVMVHPGIYYVRDVDSVGIMMRDSLVLMSAAGPGDCTLTGLNSAGNDTAYHVIYCEFGDSLSNAGVIQGFTITRGQAAGNSPHNRGGGIYCYQCSPAIQNNIIVSNSAIVGGGIYFSNSSSVLQDNIIKENTAENGGGICFYKSSPVIRGNIIQGNLAYFYGGGGYVFFSVLAYYQE